MISLPNDSSINRLTIIPSGLEIDNSTLTRDVDGSVIGAEVADLNADGSPEIYVYVASAGSGSYGSLVAYSANRRKSLSEIYLAPLTEHEAASRGYVGHDEFAVFPPVGSDTPIDTRVVSLTERRFYCKPVSPHSIRVLVSGAWRAWVIERDQFAHRRFTKCSDWFGRDDLFDRLDFSGCFVGYIIGISQ